MQTGAWKLFVLLSVRGNDVAICFMHCSFIWLGNDLRFLCKKAFIDRALLVILLI